MEGRGGEVERSEDRETYPYFLQFSDGLADGDLVCWVRELCRQCRGQSGQAGTDDDEMYAFLAVITNSVFS